VFYRRGSQSLATALRRNASDAIGMRLPTGKAEYHVNGGQTQSNTGSSRNLDTQTTQALTGVDMDRAIAQA
jgi:hypothetical protein